MNDEAGNDTAAEKIDDNVESIDSVEEIDTVEKIDTFEEIDTVGHADNVGDMSVELNVEELVADVEAANGDQASSKRDVKVRLDELNDQLDQDDAFGSTYNFDIDEDL